MALLCNPLDLSDQTPFRNLFRMLDEFDNYSRQQGTNEVGQRPKHPRLARTFNPKFDVRETGEAYELHGELPGIDRDQIDIQFTEPQTLVVRGRVERSYTSGTPPAGLIEHQATVEDAPADANGKPPAKSDASRPKKGDDKQQQQQQPADKFWLMERSVGDFSRTFNFPTRVDQDAVKAGLEKGVLSVVVPKAKKQESRRISID